MHRVRNEGRRQWFVLLALWVLPSCVLAFASIRSNANGASIIDVAADVTTVSSWSQAQTALRNDDCCVVVIDSPDLNSTLRVLQSAIADEGPRDVDLRRRIRGQYLHQDCRQLGHLFHQARGAGRTTDDNADDNGLIAALVDIAQGAISLADGPLNGTCRDVFIRIVCASHYKAHDPMFHTDKCPLRGYVTLRGVGTEFRVQPGSPWEYAKLRGLGVDFNNNNHHQLRQAQELELIVMKGDHYSCAFHDANNNMHMQQVVSSWMSWTRSFACVHRSPPGMGGRRVILSFDLAAGEDDREWFQSDKKRSWRSGMTQRKSRLVA